MSLSDALKDSVFEGLTDAECVAKFGETVELSRDDKPYLMRALNAKLRERGLSDAQLATWRESISGLTGATTFIDTLRSDGVDFTDVSTRALIQAAIDANPNETAVAALTACLDVGIQYGPRWQKHGLADEPTEAEVTAARQVIQNERDAASLLNECINPLIAERASLADIKTAVAEWGE